LARASDSSLAVKTYKVHDRRGLSPRYAAPEIFLDLRGNAGAIRVLFILLIFFFF